MRKRSFLLAGLGLALALALVWGFNQYTLARTLGLQQQNQYRQAYSDMVGHVDNMENFLAKARGSNSGNNNLINFTGAWQESNAALNDLSNLPVDNPGSSHIAQFLNQAGDFSYTLAQRMAGGGSIKPEEQKVLANIQETARKTGQDLQQLMNRADYEELGWTPKPTGWWFRGRAEADTTDATNPASVSQGLQLLDAQLQKLPPLEYEGKFASKVTQEPKGLPGGEVSKEQAAANLNKFFAQAGLSFNPQYAGAAQGTIPTYRFNLNGDANTTAEASKRGGVPVIYHNGRSIGERVLTPEQAKTKALSLLRAVGYPSMVLTSQEDHGAYLNLAYVALEDGVRIYPDKVSVSIAMDNGQMLGYNAQPYLMFHRQRSIGKTKLTVAQARRYLKPNFKVTDTALVLLAKDNYAEVLCYEFRGNMDSEQYLVYINVSSGYEEQIYRVVKTPVGEYLK